MCRINSMGDLAHCLNLIQINISVQSIIFEHLVKVFMNIILLKEAETDLIRGNSTVQLTSQITMSIMDNVLFNEFKILVYDVKIIYKPAPLLKQMQW